MRTESAPGWGAADPIVEREGPDLFRVRGVSEAELEAAVGIVGEIRALRADESHRRRDALYRAMLLHGLDPVPWETVQQVRRLVASRERLLLSGAYTTEALRLVREDSALSGTRTWISRQRERRAIFTVDQKGQTLVPAFQLGPDGAPLAALKKPLRTLIDAGMGGWELWSWFASGSPWLGGEPPLTLLDTRPDQVTSAAEAFVANLA